MKRLILSATLVLTAACAHQKPAEVPVAVAPAVKPLPQTLQEAVSSEFRTSTNTARDQYRHPVQTLEFFELKPEHTVVEISPGAGWYTEIIAPFVIEKGKYTGALRKADLNDPTNTELNKWLQANPTVAAKMNFVEFTPPTSMNLGEANSADRVLTFRNVHNWMKNKNEKAVFKAFFDVLKPGGILGVVEHRTGKKSKELRGEKGYVSEKAVIAIAQQAGFKLVEKSEINANPKDTKDYADGVWTLPPSLKLGDKDREKYLAIGESDRMTLKFVKPAK